MNLNMRRGVASVSTLRNYIFAITLTAVLCGPCIAENKSLKNELEQALVGKVVVASVMFGEKAVPHGYNADYPVHTLVSRDGSIIYRVEFGLTRLDVGTGEIVKRIEKGTSLRIAGLDMKDDRLELKLESVASSSDSAKLKLMLGNGWQSSLNSEAVIQFVTKILPDKSQGQSDVARSPGLRTSDVALLVLNAASKQPVADAAIQVCQPNCETIVKTDRFGKALLQNIPDGTLSFTVLRDGFNNFHGNAPVGAKRAFSISLQPAPPKVEDVNVAVPPEEISPEGRAVWAAKLSERYTDRVFGKLGACQLAAVGKQKDRLVGQCDSRGWVAVANAFAMSSAPAANQKELWVRGFTSFHLDPYTDGIYTVDIKGSTIERLVTNKGLREPSLDAICSIRSIDSPDERREFADLYAAFVKDSGCEVKISNARSDALMLSCRQSTPQQLATVYSDSVLAPALTDRGFKTFIFSTANDVYTPAAISENGFVKLSSITAAQLLQEYGIKSAEEIAKEEEEERNYRSFLEGFVDKMLGFSNARHAKKYASARWTQADWGQYNKAMKAEAAYIATLANNPFVRRGSFWKDSQEYASAYVGRGVWHGAPTGAFGTSVSAGSPEKDAQVRAELLAEIEQTHKAVVGANRPSNAAGETAANTQ